MCLWGKTMDLNCMCIIAQWSRPIELKILEIFKGLNLYLLGSGKKHETEELCEFHLWLSFKDVVLLQRKFKILT
jgi:hypothetical protein